MSAPGTDTQFAGSIPELYDTCMVPLIFEPYADDLAERLAQLAPARVLETAAGTGVVTRALARSLPPGCEIVATDLNQPMLDRAAAVGAARPVQWQQADALHLPFGDASFDAVVCQFGAMFFPDKVAAYAEARRVLRPGGTLLFNVWDRIEENEFADVVTQTLAQLFPDDPPCFLARTPHGYFDLQLIAQQLSQAGFGRPAAFTTVAARSRAPSPRMPCVAYCEGTPLRNEIEAPDPSRLATAIDAAERALVSAFGTGRVEGVLQGRVVTVAR
jgi:SAM-dependent methyltransferase